MQLEKTNLIALLIDAENISAYHIDVIMDEVSRYGVPAIKRIYADWTRPNMAKWKDKLLNFAISPIQQFSYTSKKNATDSALIIDAMDILYSNNIDVFFIVSSDSDFTRLTMRLREAGKFVCGIGEEKTPDSFVVSCNRFFYLNTLASVQRHNSSDFMDSLGEEIVNIHTKDDYGEANNSGENSYDETSDKTLYPQNDYQKLDFYAKRADTRKFGKKRMSFAQFRNLLLDSINDLEDDEGWVNLANLGNYLHNKRSDFDPRNYGHRKLHNLIESMNCFVLDVRPTREDPNVKHIYIRIKDK